MAIRAKKDIVRGVSGAVEVLYVNVAVVECGEDAISAISPQHRGPGP